MKVLSLASSLPYPPNHATRNRAWHLLKRLADSAEVTLVTWVDRQVDPSHLSALRSAVATLIPVDIDEVDHDLARRLRLRWASFRQGVPPFMLDRLERQKIPKVPDYFDVAVAEDDGALMLMPDVTCPVVVHRHNIFSETIGDLKAAGSLGVARKLKWSVELPIWQSFDRELSERADLSITTTPEAADALRRIYQGAVVVIENGATVPERRLTPSTDRRVVLVGTMSYEPNADSAVWFARNVWPSITAKVPGAQLEIIGYDPIPQVTKLHSGSIRVRASVPDVVDACEGATVAVVPLNAGSGIKTKTLEMMALGLPVVATPHGAEGVPASDGDGLLIRRDAQSFAQAVVEVLVDHRLAVEAGAAARRFVAERFSWDDTCSEYVKLLRQVASQKDAKGSANRLEQG